MPFSKSEIQVRKDIFRKYVSAGSRIIDYGCGYGRTCVELKEAGYPDVIGVDISSEMLHRGLSIHGDLKLIQISNGPLPFREDSFAACILLAVLTCVPTDVGQKKIIGELHRVLRPGGILYVSDYPLQQDARNRERYQRFADEFENFGVFRLSDGGVVRHHEMDWIHELLDDFQILNEEIIDVLTMNGNKATIFQLVAEKR